MRTFYKQNVVGFSESPDALAGKTMYNTKIANSLNSSFSIEKQPINIVSKVIGAKGDDMNVR